MTLTNFKLEILCGLKINTGQIISHYENKYIWALDNYHVCANRTMLCICYDQKFMLEHYKDMNPGLLSCFTRNLSYVIGKFVNLPQ